MKENNRTFSNILLDMDSIITYLSINSSPRKNNRFNEREQSEKLIANYIRGMSSNFHLYLYSKRSEEEIMKMTKRMHCTYEGHCITEPAFFLKSMIILRDMTNDIDFRDTLLVSGSDSFIKKGKDLRLNTCFITDFLDFYATPNATYNIKNFNQLSRFSKNNQNIKTVEKAPYQGVIGTKTEVLMVQDLPTDIFLKSAHNIYIPPKNIGIFRDTILKKEASKENFLVVSGEQENLIYANCHGFNTFLLNNGRNNQLDFIPTYEKRYVL